MPQTESVNNRSLNRLERKVHDLGSVWLSNHDSRRACAFGLADELSNGFGHIMRVRSVLALEDFLESAEHLARDSTDFSIGFAACVIIRLLSACVHVRGISAGLNKDDINTKLR